MYREIVVAGSQHQEEYTAYCLESGEEGDGQTPEEALRSLADLYEEED